METRTTSNRMSSLIVLYDMQTAYFLNAIEGITDKDAHNRLNSKANHIAWLTGSLVQQRFEIANRLGVEDKQAGDEFFNDNKGILDGTVYPSLESFKKDWLRISPVLRDALINVPDKKLDESFEMMPGMKMTNFDLIAFTSYREANCIGQVALWRRLLGYPPMKYM
ncbi:MAG: DinB family protein [Chitinophagaceae bacterium]